MILVALRTGEDGGIPGVAVECVDIRKNADGEDIHLALLLTLMDESVGSEQD